MSSKRSNLFFDLFDQPEENLKPAHQYKRPGQQDSGLKKLHTQISHCLDFHGLSVSQTLNIIQQHLQNNPHAHVCLLIHGKGLTSGSKIKTALLNYLSKNPRCYAYRKAPKSMGDDGASVVRFAKVASY